MEERELLARWPNPPEGAIQALDHFLDVFHDSPDSRLVGNQSTFNFYGPGIATGLTFGDLRKVQELLHASTSDAPDE